MDLLHGLVSCNSSTEYETSTAAVEAQSFSEMQRVQRMHQLLLRHENDELREEIRRCNDENQRLSIANEVSLINLDRMHAKWQASHNQNRSTTRETASLKAELHSLQDVASDSAKLLTEKLKLVREVTALRPEMEHLRNQITSQQSTLSDKLLLQRQVAALQVELDNEKRSSQKNVGLSNVDGYQDTKLESQLEAVRVELARERKDKQKVKSEGQRSIRELENKVGVLSTRLELCKDNLNAVKERSKVQQAELRAATKINVASTNKEAKPVRKRQFSLVEDDTMIGTPGGFGAGRRGKSKPLAFGEKSTFSITPFLNRGTIVNGGTPQSPVSIQGQGISQDIKKSRKADPDWAGFEFRAGAARKGQPPIIGTEKQLDKVMDTDIVGGMRVLRPLEQVLEEGYTDAENVQHDRQNSKRIFKPLRLEQAAANGDRKARTLTGGLGKTLFDDENDESGDKPSLAGGLRVFGRSQVQRNGSNRLRSFGAISPLKKDKRGK